MKRNTLTIMALASLLVSGSASAGGLYVLEFGTPSMATAGNGSNAVASDASIAFHNPAGMTHLETDQFMAAIGGLWADVEFDAAPATPLGGGNGGDQGGAAPLGSFHYVKKINDKLSLGLANFTLSAAMMDPDDDWAGRTQVQEVTIFTTNFMPSAAYQLTDKLSIGGGPMIMWGKVKQKVGNAANTAQLDIDVDGYDIGYTGSLFYKPNEKNRFGLVYASEVEPDLEGDISVNPLGVSLATQIDLVFPQTVRGSVYHELNDRWSLLSSVAWENWSDLDSINAITNAGVVALPKDWDDTFSIGIGAHYNWKPDWTLMTGFTYSSSPTDTHKRTADMPIDQQLRFAGGFKHDLRDDLTLNYALEYVDMGDGRMDTAAVQGEYDKNYMIATAISLNWSF